MRVDERRANWADEAWASAAASAAASTAMEQLELRPASFRANAPQLVSEAGWALGGTSANGNAFTTARALASDLQFRYVNFDKSVS